MHTGNENTSGRGILSRKSRRLLWLGVGGLLVLVLVATGMFISGVVLASHQFSDVPTSPASVHSAVEWIVNRAITAGCAPGLYCPGTAVTRAQMAIFLRQEGIALTPTLLKGFQFSGGFLDLDAGARVCQTSDFSVTGFPRTAKISAVFGGIGAGSLRYAIDMNYSTDSGATWLDVPLTPGLAETIDASTEWASLADLGSLDLAVGNTYRFAIHVLRNAGTADLSSYQCQVIAEIWNRNATASPLQPHQPEPPDSAKP